jgi:hypothetical protein
MKPLRLLIIVAAQLLVLFLGVNLWSGNFSTGELVEIARAGCIQAGYPANEMLVFGSSADPGIMGFGGRAEVEFRRLTILNGKESEPLWIRVELGRPMNVMKWQVRSVKQVTPTGPSLPEERPTTKPERGP